MKQTISIPKGCKTVTVEQTGNKITINFEPAFKPGDVLITDYGAISIFKELDGDKVKFYAGIDPYGEVYICNGESKFFAGYIEDKNRLASLEEAQRLFDALAKAGKRWNPYKMQVEDLKKELWRAKLFGTYYVPTLDIRGSKDSKSDIDNFRYKSGFYCQTEDQAERLYEVLKQAATDFWKEEQNNMEILGQLAHFLK